MATKGYDLLPQHAWGEGDTLHVLIGQRHDGGQHAFFFVVGSGYIGTDTDPSTPSSSVSLVAHTDVQVTLAYALYSGSGSPDSLGEAVVRFHWDGTKLTALDPIPSADWSATPHR